MITTKRLFLIPWHASSAHKSGLGTCSKIVVLLAMLCVASKCYIRQTLICNDKTTCKVSKTVSGLKILLVRKAKEVCI